MPIYSGDCAAPSRAAARARARARGDECTWGAGRAARFNVELSIEPGCPLSASLGADPTRTFFKVTMPLVMPGMISGALFAFITSFDEVVVVLFLAGPEERTIPRQMWSGIREQISPTERAIYLMMP